MHLVGVVHKDITPSNLIVDGDSVRLIDIGLLMAVDGEGPLTASGTDYYRDRAMDSLGRVGTPVSQANPKSFDVYSIGAVLFFLVEGKPPTDGGLSVFRHSVAVDIQSVVRKAMAPLSSRYSSVADLAGDLERIIE